MVTSARELNAHEAIAIANTLGGYVFGGYVRDYIAGDKFNDVDLYLPISYLKTPMVHFAEHAIMRDKFMQAAEKRGALLKFINCTQFYNSWLMKTTINFSLFTKIDAIDIDLVTSIDPFPYKKGMDVDVNYVYFDKKASCSKVIPNMGLDEKIVFEHIKHRQYDIVIDNGNSYRSTPKHRIEHIESKGYSRVSLANLNIKKSDVCEECNGSGMLDFGFYKRLCTCKLK
jgi:hypothetical protein